jgi:hypothetical protein
MQINQRIIGDVAIVEASATSSPRTGDALLTDKVRSLRQQAYTRILVDLGRVP